ncbi:MAG: sensor histidine kinase [Lachnospiraceae bacterium]|nr:sensor histidine kinase [Lachnospiraceae bacterium]
MKQILDKLIFLLCGLILLLSSSFSLTPVVLFLCAFIVLSADELLDSLKFSYAVFLAGTAVSFFLPELLFFLPALAYPLSLKRQTPVLLLFLLPAVTSPFRKESLSGFSLLLVLFFLSLLLSDRQRQLSRVSADLIKLRDTDKEEQLSLLEQAHTLIENQDAKIKIATLQERARIAREIHDNVGHLLSRSLLQVGAMLTVNKQDESLLLLKESLDDAMQGIRSSVHDLRDDAMDLETSARRILSDYTDYRTSFEYDIAPEVPLPVVYCFLAVTKEALSNITKHSNADAIRISMKEYTSLYQLSVADNGTNAVLPQDNSGMGLENMQTRVTSLNGTIRFFVQGGFHIFVSIPKEH